MSVLVADLPPFWGAYPSYGVSLRSPCPLLSEILLPPVVILAGLPRLILSPTVWRRLE